MLEREHILLGGRANKARSNSFSIPRISDTRQRGNQFHMLLAASPSARILGRIQYVRWFPVKAYIFTSFFMRFYKISLENQVITCFDYLPSGSISKNKLYRYFVNFELIATTILLYNPYKFLYCSCFIYLFHYLLLKNYRN